MENVEAFQEQVRRDVPLGTAKADVEAYLTRWDIPHQYIGPRASYPPLGNSFYGLLEDIGYYHGFTPSLNVRIFLDDTNLVREIKLFIKFF